MAKRYALDEIARELTNRGEGLRGSIDATTGPPPEICAVWPTVRAFLEWAKTQTENAIIIWVIDLLIVLGNRTCAGMK